MGKNKIAFRSAQYKPPTRKDGTLNIDTASRLTVIREYEKVSQMARKYLTVSVWLAVELYRFDPENELFKRDIFVPDSLKEVVAQCRKRYNLPPDGKKWSWELRLARWLYEKCISPVYAKKVQTPVTQEKAPGASGGTSVAP